MNHTKLSIQIFLTAAYSLCSFFSLIVLLGAFLGCADQSCGALEISLVILAILSIVSSIGMTIILWIGKKENIVLHLCKTLPILITAILFILLFKPL